jgi:hypothetical protein
MAISVDHAFKTAVPLSRLTIGYMTKKQVEQLVNGEFLQRLFEEHAAVNQEFLSRFEP